jgi:hypothetical protein
MDVRSNKRQQGSEGKDELADADEPEPDSIKSSHIECRKGRFIIEDIEEAALDEAIAAHKNFQMSFRKNKFDFFQREILEDELEFSDGQLPNYPNFKASFIFDHKNQKFIEIDEFIKKSKFDFKILITYTDIYPRNKHDDLIYEKISNGMNSDDEAELIRNDYALIIREETIEQENGGEYHDKFENYPEDPKNNSLLKNKILPPDLSPLPNNFKNKKIEMLKSPLCSPINSPRNRLLNQRGSLHFKSLQSSSKHQRVKALKHFIKSIDDSFQLEGEYQTSTGTFFRNKRLYSEDKLKFGLGCKLDSFKSVGTLRSESEDIISRKRKKFVNRRRFNSIFQKNENLESVKENQFVLEAYNNEKLQMESQELQIGYREERNIKTNHNNLNKILSIEHTFSLTLMSKPSLPNVSTLIKSKIKNTDDFNSTPRVCKNCLSLSIYCEQNGNK